MREIKFRAWHRPTSIMLPDVPTGVVYLTGKFHHSDCEYMQYTGLKDKNGKEIYEGDVVESDSYYRSVVAFNDGAFVLNAPEKDAGMQRWTVSHFELEIIGNIYENPDLIKTQND